MQVPDFCNYCQEHVCNDHWLWCKDARRYSGGYWRCRIANNVHRKKWRDCNLAHDRLLSYQAHDRRCNRECTLTLACLKLLIALPCYYCGVSNANGVDRLHSHLAHTPENCVPCCEKCNTILTDLPCVVKEILKAGLQEVQHRHLLKDWIIPTKRSRQNV